MSGPPHNYKVWCRNPEERLHEYFIPDNSFHTPFGCFPFNEWIDLGTKEAALIVSPSLVSLISYSGDEPIFWASGFCIESYNTNGIHFNNLLTSASLLCQANNSPPHGFKVVVILPNGKRCHGDVINFDMHFNVAIIRIELPTPLPCAILKRIDDSIQSFQSGSHLVPHSSLFKLVPGNPLAALARFHVSPYSLMTAPGKFSIEPCDLDCRELLRLNAKISKFGIGGPIVNHFGEVVGISFYAEEFVPFLPINVVCKWWEDVKTKKLYPKHCLGIQVSRLLSASSYQLLQIFQKFPTISKGINVEEVTEDSPASLAGICCGDVIVQFAGETVQSSMELLEAAWDKAGKRVDLTVLRSSDGARLNLSMVVGGLSPEQYNEWPLPQECLKFID
ncbi:hypothetical protein OROHE_020604 [Orobanche hederae]